MALLDVYGMPLCQLGHFPNTATLITFALDLTHETTGDGIATVFMPLANKTISEVYAHVTASTGTPPTYRIKIETMSASRTPSNTPATASCWKDITPSGAGAQWLGGAVVANHSVGATPSPLAITVRYNSGTCDASNFSTFARQAQRAMNVQLPYSLTMTAGTWGGALLDGNSMLIVVYDDGTVQPLHFYGTGTTPLVNNSTWNTGSSPMFIGNAYTPSMQVEVCGVVFTARLPDTWDFRVVVYDGTTVIRQTATFDPDQLIVSSGTANQFYLPFAPFTHPAGSKYYYVIEPTTANNPTTAVRFVCASRAAQRALAGDLVGATSPSGTPSWTTYDNGTDGYRLYPIVPVVSRIDNVTAVVNNCCFPQSNEEMIGY